MDSPLPNRPLPKRTPWQIQKAVLFALFQRELKARFDGRWLGIFWVLIEPVLHLVLLLSIYIYIRQRSVPGMPIELFLITGLIPFMIFRKISLRALGAIAANKGLFGYRQVKPLDTLITRVALETVIYSCVYVIFLAGFGWVGHQWLPERPLELFGTSLILILLGSSLGLVLVVLEREFPQVGLVARVAFMPLYLVSGVIFPVRSLPPAAIDVLAWNPLLHLMEFSRGFFAAQYPVIPQATLLYPGAWALVLTALGLSLYRLRRQKLLAS